MIRLHLVPDGGRVEQVATWARGVRNDVPCSPTASWFFVHRVQIRHCCVDRSAESLAVLPYHDAMQRASRLFVNRQFFG